jgi:plastocyanin
MKNIIIGLVVIIVLAGGGYYYFTKSATPVLEEEVMVSGMPVPTEEGAGVVEMEVMNVVEFTVEGKNFAFTPSLLSVKKGDTVKITFKNTGGFHDFVIDEFNVRTKQLQSGEETVEFVADKAGQFEYYCSVGQHRAMGMKGTLTVTE